MKHVSIDNINCEICMSNKTCSKGKNVGAKFKPAHNTPCAVKCKCEWVCSREIGHSGSHEAHTFENIAVAKWRTKPVNENLSRIV